MDPFLHHLRNEGTLIAGASYLVIRLLNRGNRGLAFEPVRKFLMDLGGHEESVMLRALLAAMEHPARLSDALEQYADYLERHGRYAEAGAIADRWKQCQPSSMLPRLTLGRLKRKLGQWDASAEEYEEVERAGVRDGNKEMELRGRVGRGLAMRHRGNLGEAEQVFLSVIAEAEAAGLPDTLALGHHNLGTVQDRTGRTEAAARSFFQAFGLYKTMNRERLGALGDLGAALRDLGCPEGARYAFQAVLANSDDMMYRLNAHIELMGISAEEGDQHGFERSRKIASSHKNRFTNTMHVDFEYQLGKGLRLFGKTELGQRHMETAAALAGEFGLHEYQHRISVERTRSEVPDEPRSIEAHPLKDIAFNLLVYASTSVK